MNRRTRKTRRVTRKRPIVDYRRERDEDGRIAHPETNPVTVCIAAICQNFEMVIAATDHKLTARNITFEPPTPKFWNLGQGMIALIAGDISAQGEICSRVHSRGPGTVADAVEAYCEALLEHNRRHAERKTLAPYGLTLQSFLESQDNLAPDFVQSLQFAISKSRATVETIICGVDSAGPHVYRIGEDGCDHRFTDVGFTAIGDGADHAESQFMNARYSPEWGVGNALPLLYAAKKRAEVAPGVGTETTMLYISQADGVQPMRNELVSIVESGHARTHLAYVQATNDEVRDVMQFIYPAMQGESQPPLPEPTADASAHPLPGSPSTPAD